MNIPRPYKVSANKHDFGSNLIRMIKAYRQCFHVLDWNGDRHYTVGLRDAKIACEAMMQGDEHIVNLSEQDIKELRNNGFMVNNPDYEVAGTQFFGKVTVYRAPSGRKIEDIKDFRYCYNCGLKEAKDAVEHMEGGQPFEIKNPTQEMIDHFKIRGFVINGVVEDHFETDLFEI